jgi:hypothetical protein
LPLFLIILVRIIIISSPGIWFLLDEFLHTSPMDLNSILNPVNPTEPLPLKGKGPGGGEPSNSGSTSKLHTYDTTKLADHLETYKGQGLNKTDLNMKESLFTEHKTDIGRIFSYVQKENSNFFSKNMGATLVNDRFIGLIRDLKKDYR